ncbi:hypothetical protein QEN19_002289 [Hanseniaspora menglaensis]
MSWFTKNGLYEKVALYCIDKSPLIVDKDDLTCKDGVITMKNVRINHSITKKNDSNVVEAHDNNGFLEVNGIIECLVFSVSSLGLYIEFAGSELVITGANKNIDVNMLKEDLAKSVNIFKGTVDAFNLNEDDLGFKNYSKDSGSSTSDSSSNIDVNRQNSTSSIDSFGYTKSVMFDIASSFMGSIEDFKNSDTFFESSETNIKNNSQAAKDIKDKNNIVPEDMNLNEDEEPPRSILDSFKKKIIDIALSNFQIKLNKSRLILTDMELAVDIESMEAKSTENERFLDFYSVKVFTSKTSGKNEEHTESDDEDENRLMSSSLYMSAISSFSKKLDKDFLKSNDTYDMLFSLTEISFYFISNNDPKKFIPKEILVSPFTLEHADIKFLIESFNILVSKTINKYTFKITEFVFQLLGNDFDKNGFKFELFSIEYGYFVKNQHKNESIPTFDTITIQKFKISHKHLNLSSKKSKSGNEAIVLIIKDTPNDFSIECKLKTLELVAKTYRINSGIIVKIPRIFATYSNKKLKGAIKTFSVSLIENFKKLNMIDDLVLVDNIGFQFYDKTLDLNIDDFEGNFCGDSFNCFIQTMMDMSFSETFPENLRFKREIDEPIANLDEMILEDDYFTVNNLFNEEDYINLNTPACLESENQKFKNYKFKKNFLSDIIKNMVNKSANGIQDLNENIEALQFTLNLQVERLKLKMYDGYHFDYTRNVINRTIIKSKQTDKNSVEEEKSNVFFNSIYITSETPKASTLDLDTSGYLDDYVFSNKNSLPFGKNQKQSGELVTETLKFKFENMVNAAGTENQNTEKLGALISRFTISTKKLEIFDKIESSLFNKFFTSFKSPQLDHSCFEEKFNMIDVTIENVRPDLRFLTSELRIFVKTSPIKLHINEDFVDFLLRFFTFKDNRFELIDEYPEEIFIQKLEILGLNISIDYKSIESKTENDEIENSKKVKSVFLNKIKSYIVVENCEIKLKHLIVYGLDSFEDLGEIIQKKWVTDIVNSQRLALMSGVSPLKSAINLSSAVKNLVEQPLQQSSKVGWTRSLQNGFLDFGKTTSNELLKLGLNISAGTQSILEATETNLTAGGERKKDEFLQNSFKANRAAMNDDLIGSVLPQSFDSSFNKNYNVSSTTPERSLKKRVDITHPETFKEGLSLAYSALEDNFKIAFETAMKTGQKIHETENNSEAAKIFLNNMGITILRPLIGASGALNKSFQGLQAQMQDEEINYYVNERLKDKYKQ